MEKQMETDGLKTIISRINQYSLTFTPITAVLKVSIIINNNNVEQNENIRRNILLSLEENFKIGVNISNAHIEMNYLSCGDGKHFTTHDGYLEFVKNKAMKLLIDQLNNNNWPGVEKPDGVNVCMTFLLSKPFEFYEDDPFEYLKDETI